MEKPRAAAEGEEKIKKQKRMGGWILAVIVLLGIVGTGSRLSLVFAGQTGTSFEEAREIKKPELGKTLSGALTPEHARTYYQLTLKEPGRLSAEISSGKLPAIAFTLCDDQRRELASESFQGKEGWAAYLEKGTYYLIFSGTAEEKAVFTLKIEFSRAAAADVEPNDTIISPQPVLANAVYKGLLSLTDRTDVYTVKVEKPEKLYVAVKNEFTGTLNVQVKREGGAFFGSGTEVFLIYFLLDFALVCLTRPGQISKIENLCWAFAFLAVTAWFWTPYTIKRVRARYLYVPMASRYLPKRELKAYLEAETFMEVEGTEGRLEESVYWYCLNWHFIAKNLAVRVGIN